MTENVLITGGAGFIGTHLTDRLERDGYRVTVFDSLLPQVHGAAGEERARARLGDRLILGDVRDPRAIREVLEGQDVVIHLAAETGTGQSMYEIDRYVDVNVGGTAKILDTLANHSHTVKRFVVASSRSIYGEGSYRDASGMIVHPPHRAEEEMAKGDFAVHMSPGDTLEVIATDESAKLHPSSVYGITKQVQESLVMTVAPTLGIEPVSLRYQNVYGPGQSLSNPYTGILSIFAGLIREGKEINIFEDGLESRDFVYVEDVAEATALAVSVPSAAGAVINVGSGVATTVTEVVEALFLAFNKRVPATVSGNFRLGDIRHNFADTSRMASILGFTPQVAFPEGVRRFAEWVSEEDLSAEGYARSLREMSSRNLLK